MKFLLYDTLPAARDGTTGI